MKNAHSAAALAALSLVWLNSCAVEEPHQVTFNQADFAQGTGTGSVVGQAFTVLNDNSVIYAKNDSVDLVPVNAYTTEIIEREVAKGERLTPSPAFQKYIRSAPTDSEGRFAYHNLAPGDYYVVTKVYFTHTYYQPDNEGFLQKASYRVSQWIYVETTVKNGQTARIDSWNQRHTQAE